MRPQFTNIIVADNYTHALAWAENVLGPIIEHPYNRWAQSQRDIEVLAPSGRAVPFEIKTNWNSLRGLRYCNSILGAEGISSELQHAVWESWHRTELIKGRLTDIDLLCWAWTQEPLMQRLAHYNPRREPEYGYSPF